VDLAAALAELYRAPHAEFVATRKRVAAELAAHDDLDGAARVAKLARPSLSAWVVNQLWWSARATFENLIDGAMRLQDGDSKGGATYRDAMTKLRARAAAQLEASGHAATEQALRRVTTTLAAIATAGGFHPDEPGTLTVDREPGAVHGEVTVTVPSHRIRERETTSVDDGDDDDRNSRPTLPAMPKLEQPPPPPKPAAKPRIVNGRVHPHVEVHSEDDQQTHVVTERSLLEAALTTARRTIEANEREREQLQRRLAEVERAIHQARTIVTDVEARLVPDDSHDS
jgi:hypothetical protein